MAGGNGTQRERIAALEASEQAHVTAHELTDRLWTAKLEAVDARLGSIERMLSDVLLRPVAGADDSARPSSRRRDIAAAGGGAGAATLLWWLAQAAEALSRT